MSDESIRSYWDERARENPHYFVDNRLDYSEPDLEQFWAGGVESLDRVLDSVGARVEPGDDIVEVGCGVGRLTRELSARAASVRAVDVSPQMIEVAKESNPGLSNVEWIVGDGTSLAGVADASADGCVSDVVFQHIPDPSITLGYVAEIARVLRPGGWAAFQVSNDPSIHATGARPAGERLKTKLKALLGRGPRGQDNPAWLGSAVDLEELAASAESRGASVERVAGAGTQFCYVLLRKG